MIEVVDDRSIRESFQICLESEGYQVETFSDGKEALERLHKVPEPCLVLLDLMMPVMNGIEFMLEFSKLPATVVPIPVYLCSATATQGDARRLGCDGFIKKPVDLEILLMIVKNHCPIT